MRHVALAQCILKLRPFNVFTQKQSFSSLVFKSQRRYYTAGNDRLEAFLGSLDSRVPRFEIPVNDIEILHSPNDFYKHLLQSIDGAQERIFLSTLYIGKSEYEIVNHLDEALEKNPKVKLSLLFDALRGTREAPKECSASLVAPLISKFGPERVSVNLFHTPNLYGWKKSRIPRRFNEGWGLQHMKIYGVDDELLLSGANLSNDYFTNRQDRYHIFRSSSLADWYSDLLDAVSKISYRLSVGSDFNPSGKSFEGLTLDWAGEGPSPSDGRPSEFMEAATKIIGKCLSVNSSQSKSIDILNSAEKAIVYPLVQMGSIIPSDLSTEYWAIRKLLELLSDPTAQKKWAFTAGYFNPEPEYQRLLLESSDSDEGVVIAASPYANGFYGSSGLSGRLPTAYTHLLTKFMERIKESKHISVEEWQKGVVNQLGGWSYHAKGP